MIAPIVAVSLLVLSFATFPVAAAPQPIGPAAGVPVYQDDLAAELRAAVVAKGPEYKARTRHLIDGGWPRYTNRLILERSPYLLQHAHNPVDWHPWGDEAFERARKEGKPVLLSVGYSTCHWCHVMEEESFEDVEIASYINQNYIAVKVDRERRPDVDGVYMMAVRTMVRRGGWPMTVWLTPDREPFYGGTYFPARDGDRGTRTGFRTLLEKLKKKYDEDPASIVTTAADVRDRVAAAMENPAGSKLPDASILNRALESEARAFDEELGGFGSAPKFPRSVRLEFLLRQHRRSGDERALRMVTKTLGSMAAGGMYDQIGGGFHRYSTDARWLVPHFEKMLYDNGQLVVAYVEAYQATGDPAYARIAREILAYIEREMTSPEGGFYSATDADSEGEEGTFFVWTPKEVRALLTGEEARLAIAYYGVTEKGNFEGKNILTAARPIEDVAKELGIEVAVASKRLEAARRKLYVARSKRIPPLPDRKILPAWNGLMISAFARAAFVLGEQSYVDIASRAATFILSQMGDQRGLRRSFLDGAASGRGFLDDYTFMTAGLLDLYEATYDPRRIRAAIALQSAVDNHFRDPKGGYFLTSDAGERLLAREKPSYDGAEPSGNSVALLNLLRLHEFTTDDRYRASAEALMKSFEMVWRRAPTSVPRMLAGIDFWLDGAKEIVIVVPESVEQAEPFLTQMRANFAPNRVLSVVTEGDHQKLTATLLPLVAGKKARGGKATAYVCERQVCDLPTTEPQVFAKQLAKPAAGEGAAAPSR